MIELERLFFQTRVLSRKQYNPIISLLTIFAQHLSFARYQILVQPRHEEPAAVTCGWKFIEDHLASTLTLADVARAANTSTYYFCKLFKRETGLNFSEYVSQLRVEKAKSLLPNLNLRVSEIGYEVGFQSLTHFNRLFKRITGLSPTLYRARLPKFDSG